MENLALDTMTKNRDFWSNEYRDARLLAEFDC